MRARDETRAAEVQTDAEAGKNLEMHGSINPREQEWFLVFREWAVGKKTADNPLENDPCILADLELRSVQDVINTVTLIATVHPAKRNPLIGCLADAMTRVFRDSSYHRAYCKMLWQAWKGETEGRSGLQALQAQLARLNADRREWAELRRPGALLVSRMRAAWMA